ncbi:MAG: hypothetical protein AAB415_02545 [Patescibacteria group bacterium]
MRHKKLLVFLSVFLLLLSVSLVFIQLTHPADADSPNSDVSGYAWMSNNNWIKFKGEALDGRPYGVNFTRNIADSGGRFVGHAWSSNLGWIDFNSNLTGSLLDPFPEAPNHGPWLESNGSVTGWARACSVFEGSDCSGNLRPPSQNGGWDGWIKMSGLTDPPTSAPYGVTLVGNKFEGYAWGADVVGFIDFCANKTNPALGPNACVTLDSANVTCTVAPTSVGLNLPVTWTGSANPSNPAYIYDWSWTGSVSDDMGSATGPTQTISGGYSQVESVTGEVTVTDGVGGPLIGTDSCTLNVNPADTKTLQVIIDGDGASYGHVSSIDGFINCVGNNPPCSHDYPTTQASVNLTQSVSAGSPGVTFTGWSVPGSGAGTVGDPRVVPLDANPANNTVVRAFFDDPTITSSAIITIIPNFIRILQQRAGVPKESTSAVVTVNNTSIPVTNIDACLVSVKSKVDPSKTLESIIAGAPLPPGITGIGANTPPTCSFLGDEGCSNNCRSFGGGMNQGDISITIADKLYEVKQFSPYEVTIQAANDTKTLEFRYEVSDIVPR